MATGFKYQVQETIFDPKSMLDEENFYNQRQGAPSELTRKLTYILGSYNNDYPLSMMTEGGVGFGIGNTTVELDDVQFTYPVMGRDDKASVVSSSLYVTGDKPGIGNQPFYLFFPDNWIKRYYIIQSELGVQAYVAKDPDPVGDGTFKYTCYLDPAGPSDFCPVSQTQTGVRWIDLYTAVSESESRTTESKMVSPGLFKNQMGFMRAGMSWSGNSANKMMKINVMTDKGETNVWMDFAMWQFEKRWLNECEHLYWYSKYNRQANGQIALKDLLSGKVIPRGSGVLEQIQNRSSYSDVLTYKAFTSKISDALFGQSDTNNMSITLHTGTGGMRTFHQMIMAQGATVLTSFGAGNVADKFVTGTGYNLALGGYFSTLYHIDGYVIKVKKNPIFDRGRVAMASPLHPESGLPLESYRMVFLDDGDYDGQPNIQHVAQKGRSFLHGIIPGLTPLPRSLNIMGGFNISNKDAAMALATDKDESGYTRFKSAGIQILRANKCFDMICTAGQNG